MRFLAFEGLDGSGKSTLMNNLKAEFQKRGREVVLTREPGGTPLGDEIRQMLLRTTGDTPCPRAEALLYQAGRAQHVDKLIRPSLKQNKWVLSDRFAASSVAFQAGGRELNVNDIEWLNAFSTNDLQPDLYVLLDLSVEESLRRLQGRAEEADRFEREQASFHERVRQSYLQMAAQAPKKWFTISAAKSPQDVFNAVISELKSRQWLD
jgi:dTMP kinase